MSKVGTQPIIGTQINLRFQNIIGKVTLYATTEQGYKNLTKLSSSSYLKNNETNDPSCEINDLISNNEDLILLTGNYYNFFGKLFYANKIKDFEKIINSFKSNFKIQFFFISIHDNVASN